MREYFDEAVEKLINSEPSSTPQEIKDFKLVMEGVAVNCQPSHCNSSSGGP